MLLVNKLNMIEECIDILIIVDLVGASFLGLDISNSPRFVLWGIEYIGGCTLLSCRTIVRLVVNYWDVYRA